MEGRSQEIQNVLPTGPKMKSVYTPKQLSRAIDVSESSIKRWCDKGMIDTQYTAGGHRRISMASVAEFLRGSKHKLISPEALGLPPTSGQTERVVRRAKDQFAESLLAGDQSTCWQIAFDLYLAEHSISTICDEVFAEAFREIGDRWACGSAEVYQERRGCEIMLRVLHDMRSLVKNSPANAPLAIGGSPSGDQYSLGTSMAELVLIDGNWNATSLGDNLPFATLSAAIQEKSPRLFWLSCSHLENVEEFLRGYSQFYDQHSANVAFVVGGYALTEEIRQQMRFSAYCDSMEHLRGFAQTLLQSRSAEPTQPSMAAADPSHFHGLNGTNNGF